MKSISIQWVLMILYLESGQTESGKMGAENHFYTHHFHVFHEAKHKDELFKMSLFEVLHELTIYHSAILQL